MSHGTSYCWYTHDFAWFRLLFVGQHALSPPCARGRREPPRALHSVAEVFLDHHACEDLHIVKMCRDRLRYSTGRPRLEQQETPTVGLEPTTTKLSASHYTD